MNPYAPYLLAALNITEETRYRYPLGDVQDVQAADEGNRLTILVLTKNDPAVDAAITQHRSFLRKQPDEQNPDFVTYIFGIPSEHRQNVLECLAQPDYPS